MSSSSSTQQDKHPTEIKSLLPQHTRTRNIHSPRKSRHHHQQQQPLTPSFPDESPQPHHLPQPHYYHHRRCRILISSLFALTSLFALLSLSLKFIIFPYLLPTPTPSLRILSLSLLNPHLAAKPNSSTVAYLRVSISNPTWASTFHFSDSAYTLRYNSKPISETNPNVRLQIPPDRTLEIAYDMLLEKNDDTKRGLEEMIYRAGRRETVVLDVTVYLYGSSAIRPWSVRMVALFYDCVGIAVDFSTVDGGGKVASDAACELVEKLTS